MIYAIQSEVLDRLIDGVSKIGEKKKSIELGEEPKYISLREAGRKYGEVVVKEWIKAGVVKETKTMERVIIQNAVYLYLSLKRQP